MASSPGKLPYITGRLSLPAPFSMVRKRMGHVMGMRTSVPQNELAQITPSLMNLVVKYAYAFFLTKQERREISNAQPEPESSKAWSQAS
jgi:hypothetical protein